MKKKKPQIGAPIQGVEHITHRNVYVSRLRQPVNLPRQTRWRRVGRRA